jgi:hypothetical protein
MNRLLKSGQIDSFVVQQLNATGTVTNWNSIVEIGATPLTANITITLPAIDLNQDHLGGTVTFKRLDNTAFTVTIVGASGQTTEITSPTVLNTQFGALTVTVVSSTKSEQTSSIGGATTATTSQALSATGTATAWNSIVTVGAGTANVTTLPAITASDIGKLITIKNVSIGVNTQLPPAGVTLVGGQSLNNNESVTFVAYDLTTIHSVSDRLILDTYSNALTKVANNVELGGTLLKNTTIAPNGFNLTLGSATAGTSTTNLVGSVSNTVVNTTAAAYTVLATDYHIRLTLAGSQTVTLPAAGTATGRIYKITNPTGYLKTISSIIGMSFAAITTISSRETFEVQSDGTNWVKISTSGENFDSKSLYLLNGAWNGASIICGGLEFIMNGTTSGAAVFLQARCVGLPATRSVTANITRFSGGGVNGVETPTRALNATYAPLNSAATAINANYVRCEYYINDRNTGEAWQITVINDGSINLSINVIYTRP